MNDDEQIAHEHAIADLRETFPDAEEITIRSQFWLWVRFRNEGGVSLTANSLSALVDDARIITRKGAK